MPRPNRNPAGNTAYLKTQGFEGDVYIEPTKEPNKQFLIICEGENTEPRYFRGFPITGATVEIHGAEKSEMKLVDYALQQQQNPGYKDHEIWCVFDMDLNPDEAVSQRQDFNSAIEKAYSAGLKVAWSNDSFEIWFLLHFQLVANEISRNEVDDKLCIKWKLKDKRKRKQAAFCTGHYDRHLKQQPAAIKHAQALHQSFAGRTDFASQNPCTTVYLLVQELNKYLKP